jgi:hypothetical protein
VSKSADRVEAILILVGALVCVVVLSLAIEGHLIREQEQTPKDSPSRRGPLITDAASVVAQLASLMEQDRRSGIDNTRDREALAATRRSARLQRLEVSATHSGFVIEATEKQPLGAWVRLAVDRRSRRVMATCGGAPTVYCTDGRWRIEEHGLSRRYLLGR